MAKKTRTGGARKSGKAAKPKTAAKARSARPRARETAARPAAVHFTAAQLKKIQEQLEQELARLSLRLGDIEHDDSGTEAANVGDIVDAASAQETRAVLQGLQQTEFDQKRLVEAALARVKAGNYGRCQKCDGPVEAARLEAIPYAENCIACKKKDELSGMRR